MGVSKVRAAIEHFRDVNRDVFNRHFYGRDVDLMDSYGRVEDALFLGLVIDSLQLRGEYGVPCPGIVMTPSGEPKIAIQETAEIIVGGPSMKLIFIQFLDQAYALKTSDHVLCEVIESGDGKYVGAEVAIGFADVAF